MTERRSSIHNSDPTKDHGQVKGEGDGGARSWRRGRVAQEIRERRPRRASSRAVWVVTGVVVFVLVVLTAFFLLLR